MLSKVVNWFDLKVLSESAYLYISSLTLVGIKLANGGNYSPS